MGEKVNKIELQVGVKILLRNSAGKYLLLERSDKKYPETAGTWDIVGGRIHPGTKLLENLKREVKEETGLDILGEPKLIAAQDILRVPGKHIVRLTHTGDINGGLVKLDDENKSYAWLTLEEIKQHDNLDIYLKELLEKRMFD